MDLVSILIPARNEEVCIAATVQGIKAELDTHHIPFEIIIVNDNSQDQTKSIIEELNRQDPRIRLLDNPPPCGIGNAIKTGLNDFKGDCVVITMADASDSPADMTRYIRVMEQGLDCCFGTRWTKDARVTGYPLHKLLLNRGGNWLIKIMFGIAYNDVTNAFKCYSRQTIAGLKPIMSHHFNITVELPLKAIVRGYSYSVIPTNWHNRRKGFSNLKIQEMGSRYFFVILCILLEKLLCRSDYQKKSRP